MQAPPIQDVSDNLSFHERVFCTPNGIWSSPDRTSELRKLLLEAAPGYQIYLTPNHELPPADAFPFGVEPNCGHPLERPFLYLLSYVPPPSRDGSCHRIRVKLVNAEGKVFSRDEYCNIQHPANDPLLQTELGKRMEDSMSSPPTQNLSFSAQVAWVFGNLETARVYVSLDLPWNTFDARWTGRRFDPWNADVAVLGLVYGREGLVTRFSDTACKASGAIVIGSTSKLEPVLPAAKEALKAFTIPSRYQTELDLAPGTYSLKLAVTDGTKFGVSEMPLQIDSFDPRKLAISSVILSKRARKIDDGQLATSPDGPALATPNAKGTRLSEASKFLPLVSKGIEFTPEGDTRFKAADAVAAYFQIYEPLLAASNATARARFRVRIIDVSTGELKVDSGLRDAMSYVQPGNPVIAISQGIDVGKLAPGQYRIEVQATDSTGQTTDWRTATFMVEPQ